MYIYIYVRYIYIYIYMDKKIHISKLCLFFCPYISSHTSNIYIYINFICLFICKCHKINIQGQDI